MESHADLSQQLAGAVDPGAEVQAQGAAGAIALVLTAQRQVGLGRRVCIRSSVVPVEIVGLLTRTHTVQTVVALLHLLMAPLPLHLQLPLLLLQVGLQLRDAFPQPVLIQQAVGVLQLQAVTAPQGLEPEHGS